MNQEMVDYSSRGVRPTRTVSEVMRSLTGELTPNYRATVDLGKYTMICFNRVMRQLGNPYHVLLAWKLPLVARSL